MKMSKEDLKNGLKFIGTVIIPVLTLLVDGTLKFMDNKDNK